LISKFEKWYHFIVDMETNCIQIKKYDDKSVRKKILDSKIHIKIKKINSRMNGKVSAKIHEIIFHGIT